MLRSFAAFITLILMFQAHAQVTMRDTLISWKHFDYSLDQYYGLSSYSSTDIVDKEFNGIVLENELVKLCLIPEFGGRIISFVYKPTKQEQLYQNPIGVPYSIGNKIFYHDWLMVYGGIFPTFPEPEHGKYWAVPWSYEVTHNSSEKITLSMWLKDDLNNPVHPGQYGNGVTGITCYFDVTLDAGQPYFDIDVRLENDQNPTSYEYWTCITFSPGSEIGNTYSPSNSEMIVPIESYYVAWNLGEWMNNLDPMLESDETVRQYDKLAHLSNWTDMGIAYAHPTIEDNFYGVINHDNESGLFRLSSDQSTTPGMKFWTWGDERGLAADPTDFETSARPYIELWSGTAIQFFWGSYFEANEKLSWTESYLPTIGLPDVSYMAKDMAFHSEMENEIIELMAFNSVNENYSVSVNIKGAENEVKWENDYPITLNKTEAFNSTIDLKSLGFSPESHEITLELKHNGSTVYTKTYGVSIDEIEPPVGIEDVFDPLISITQNQTIHLQFEQSDRRGYALFDLQGKRLNAVISNDKSMEIAYPKPGVYIIQVVEQQRRWTKKILIN